MEIKTMSNTVLTDKTAFWNGLAEPQVGQDEKPGTANDMPDIQELIKAGLNLGGIAVGAISAAKQNQMKQAIKASCGPRPAPWPFSTKAKRDAYNKCAAEVAQKILNPQQEPSAPTTEKPKTGLIIGVVLGSAAILGTVIFIAVKSGKKGK